MFYFIQDMHATHTFKFIQNALYRNSTGSSLILQHWWQLIRFNTGGQRGCLILKKILVLNATEINFFSICHWDLYSISTNNYHKIFLLSAYISLHQFDVVCISEIYLDSTTALDDNNLEIAGYNLLRANYTSKSKRGSVYIYCKSSITLGLIDVHYLKECLIFESLIGGKLCNFISLYWSLSQSFDSF